MNRREFARSAAALAALTAMPARLPGGSPGAGAPRVDASLRPKLPTIAYGAVYFRKSNPPREDWERDYRTAAEDGINTFRHWFLWAAIEVAPGKYDWDDYDRQFDLAAQHGIRTIIAENLTYAPEWAFEKWPDARFQDIEGRAAHSLIKTATNTGGFPGLTLNHPAVKAQAGAFLTAMAARYKDHPGLGGWDIWNEVNVEDEHDYSPWAVAAFRDWLKRKYGGDLQALGRAWHRQSYTSWSQVDAPRALMPYAENLDWHEFRIDNAYELMRWRIDTVRAVDTRSWITAHGTAASLYNLAEGASHDWRGAQDVEIYGFSFVQSTRSFRPAAQWLPNDLTRSASEGKDFWHAEAQGGSLWFRPGALERPREDGRVFEPEDVRITNLTSFAAGARGILNPRWRPLLEGPLVGAFGWYALDGSRTPNSEMGGRTAKWANAPAQAPVWKARPIRGDLAVLFLPEAQIFAHTLQFSVNGLAGSAWYAGSAQGAYNALFELNLQPDWLILGDEDLDAHAVIYVPLPLRIGAATVGRLRSWVEAGGTLVSEGTPGYWDDRGRAHENQPAPAVADLFGVREAYVEFTPDLTARAGIEWNGAEFPAALFQQAYEPTSGRAVATFNRAAAPRAAGRAAMVENRIGRGRTLLIGTFPGFAHRGDNPARSRAFFDALRDWAGVRRAVAIESQSPGPLEHGNPAGGAFQSVTARIHQGGGETVLWVTNPVRADRDVVLQLDPSRVPGAAGFTRALPHWPEGAPPLAMSGGRISCRVPGRDALVVRLG